MVQEKFILNHFCSLFLLLAVFKVWYNIGYNKSTADNLEEA